MRQNINRISWEPVTTGDTYRLKVIGGWIVQETVLHESGNGLSTSMSMVFVSDPEHKWVIVSE